MKAKATRLRRADYLDILNVEASLEEWSRGVLVDGVPQEIVHAVTRTRRHLRDLIDRVHASTAGAAS